jgi:hypothetical protein
MSNSERIQRAAAEAAAKTEEKAAKKAAAKPRAPRAPREPKAPPRMKIIWGVMEPGSTEPAATYAYPDRAAADADCAKRGKNYVVKPLKVPM